MLFFVPRYPVVSNAFIEIGVHLQLDINVLGTLIYFYFDQQTVENPKSFRNLKLRFFC